MEPCRLYFFRPMCGRMANPLLNLDWLRYHRTPRQAWSQSFHADEARADDGECQHLSNFPHLLGFLSGLHTYGRTTTAEITAPPRLSRSDLSGARPPPAHIRSRELAPLLSRSRRWSAELVAGNNSPGTTIVQGPSWGSPPLPMLLDGFFKENSRQRQDSVRLE